jgi:hypothetical protein
MPAVGDVQGWPPALGARALTLPRPDGTATSVPEGEERRVPLGKNGVEVSSRGREKRRQKTKRMYRMRALAAFAKLLALFWE